jgi:RNA polymerase sigma-70 factor (ECF subfamily)
MTPTDDRSQLESLYREHAAAVLRYARRRVDPATADDIVAETFLVAWRRRAAVPPDALPWLYAVAANVLRNHRRSARRQTAVSERMQAEPAPGLPEAHAAAPDHAVLHALAALRPIDREAILLTAWEDLPAERAAAAAGCSTSAFHVRLHRAKRRLAAALAAGTHPEPVLTPALDRPEPA